MVHKTDWKLKDTVKPEDLNRIEENNSELESPTFDDTGTVSDINSFTDFINSVKSRMNIFEFFKNFKAGLKYIVHQGQIINSQDVTQAGFALDARQANPNISGTLGAKISDLNNNKLDKTEFDNLTIGGRNLVKGTSTVLELYPQGGANENTVHGTVSNFGKDPYELITTPLSKLKDWKVGDTITFSYDWEATGSNFSGTFNAGFNASPWEYTPKVTLSDTNTKGRFTYTKTLTESDVGIWASSTAKAVRFRMDNIPSGIIIKISNLKVEFGNKPTDWTPAPEDLENPVFDDSGTTEGINSFTDFMNSVKSKMNIFQFYRDFKAGMKYVLHTGRLANNATTTQEGFALDARMGKTLQDQITDVNKNIAYKQFSDISLDIINNTIYPESYVGYITREVSQQLGLPYAVHQIRYTKYADVEPYGLQEVFQTTDDNIGKFSYRKGNGVHGWSGWKTITINNDFDDVSFGKAYIQLGSDTGISCRIYYNGEIRAVDHLKNENYENNYRSFNLLK